jgi:hypothetical protein
MAQVQPGFLVVTTQRRRLFGNGSITANSFASRVSRSGFGENI